MKKKSDTIYGGLVIQMASSQGLHPFFVYFLKISCVEIICVVKVGVLFKAVQQGFLFGS